MAHTDAAISEEISGWLRSSIGRRGVVPEPLWTIPQAVPDPLCAGIVRLAVASGVVIVVIALLSGAQVLLRPLAAVAGHRPAAENVADVELREERGGKGELGLSDGETCCFWADGGELVHAEVVGHRSGADAARRGLRS